MIDTHCHIDMYPNPVKIADESEKLGIITIGMTNLPSHFEMGYKHIRKYKKVRLALGMHPLNTELHNKEFQKFLHYLDYTSYIGEIGLDFSKEGIGTKDLQIESFKRILHALKNKTKILSLHSRNAEKEVFNYLVDFNIQLVIFHWYSGSLPLIDTIASNGYYFSVNPAMIKSKSGRQIIERIPRDKILIESDGPFLKINKIPAKPFDVKKVYEYLSKSLDMTESETAKQISNNFNRLKNKLLNK